MSVATWGGTTERGFTPVARAFLRNYNMLGITMEEAMTTLHIIDFAWGSALPFPKVARLVELTGKSENSIRKYIASLRDKELLNTTIRRGRSNEYDFSPLFNKLKELENADKKEPASFQETTPPKTQDFVEQPTQNVDPCLPKKEVVHRRIRNNNNKLKNKPLAEILEASLAFAEQSEKGNKRQANKRMRRFLDKPPEKYNAKDVEMLFAQCWIKKWNSPLAKFTLKDLALVKKLNQAYSPETVAKVVELVFERWEDLKKEFNIRGYPSVPLLWGYRNSLFTFLLQDDGNTKPQWGSHFDDSDSREEGDEIGW